MVRMIPSVRRLRRCVYPLGVAASIAFLAVLAACAAPLHSGREVGVAPINDITPKGKTADADSPLSPNWIVTVQLGPGALPIYPGAGRLRAVPIPGVEFRRPGETDRFSAPDDGLGADIMDFGSFRAGPVAVLVPPRDPKYPQTWGLRRVDIAFEFGGFAEFFLGDYFRIRAEMRKGLTGQTGYVATIATDLVNQSGPLRVSLGPRVRFGSDRFAEAYFGVTPAQSRINRYMPPFEAKGGLMSAGLMGTMRYDVNKDWDATAYGGLSRLASSAAASPITNMTGSRNQYSLGLLIGRRFEVSGL